MFYHEKIVSKSTLIRNFILCYLDFIKFGIYLFIFEVQ